jgi:hypothetical protein
MFGDKAISVTRYNGAELVTISIAGSKVAMSSNTMSHIPPDVVGVSTTPNALYSTTYRFG